jgi:hypothetical protein
VNADPRSADAEMNAAAGLTGRQARWIFEHSCYNLGAMAAIPVRIHDEVDETAGRALLVELRDQATDLQKQVWTRKLRAALTTGPARTLSEDAVVGLVPGITAATIRQWRAVGVMTRPTPPTPEDWPGEDWARA